jgi:phosphoglycolate phosphatase
MPVSLILYDLDGTLANTKQDLAVAVNRTLTQLGLPTRTHEELYGFVGNGVRMLLSRAVGGESDPAALSHAIEVFRGHYMAHLTDHTTLYPGVDEVLNTFAHLQQAIVTNKPMGYTDGVVTNLGLSQRVGLVLGGDSTPHLKPNPAILHAALDHFGATPEQAIMVGDGLPDLGAARAAGIRCALLTCGMGDPEVLRAAEPDYLFDNIAELIPTVASLNGQS